MPPIVPVALMILAGVFLLALGGSGDFRYKVLTTLRRGRGIDGQSERMISWIALIIGFNLILWTVPPMMSLILGVAALVYFIIRR